MEEKKERDISHRFFKAKTPQIKDYASDNLKSRLGDPEDFIDRKSAFLAKDDSPRELLRDS